MEHKPSNPQALRMLCPACGMLAKLTRMTTNETLGITHISALHHTRYCLATGAPAAAAAPAAVPASLPLSQAHQKLKLLIRPNTSNTSPLEHAACCQSLTGLMKYATLVITHISALHHTRCCLPAAAADPAAAAAAPAAVPASLPLSQAHQKLKPPIRPKTSNTSPHRYRPGSSCKTPISATRKRRSMGAWQH